jgi:NADH-quinone oxidoreductase subunit H
MKFAMFFMAEYTHMIVASSVIVALYFGGWQVPFLSQQEMISSVGQIGAFLLSVISFSIKTGLFLFFFIWIRWTLPRFRFDQLINLGWKVLLPIAILNLLITAGVVIYA